MDAELFRHCSWRHHDKVSTLYSLVERYRLQLVAWANTMMSPKTHLFFVVFSSMPYCLPCFLPSGIRKPAKLSPDLYDQSIDAEDSVPHLVFPGGGIYFYWQAGAVSYLREQGYDLDGTTMTGASAGALCATLAATDVDFYEATELALSLAAEAGVWNRSGGLQGIWGPMIHDWLDELLPQDAAECVNDNTRLTLLMTAIPSFTKVKVSCFQNREDLIRCNMASVHLPWFLDSKLTANFRNRPYIDGSFLVRSEDYRGGERNEKSTKAVFFTHNQDPLYQSQNLLSFVEAVNPNAIRRMLDDGKQYACIMEEQGKFSALRKRKLRQGRSE